MNDYQYSREMVHETLEIMKLKFIDSSIFVRTKVGFKVLLPEGNPLNVSLIFKKDLHPALSAHYAHQFCRIIEPLGIKVSFNTTDLEEFIEQFEGQHETTW